MKISQVEKFFTTENRLFTTRHIPNERKKYDIACKKLYGGAIDLRIAVCDDEKIIRSTIAEYIKLKYPMYEVLEYESGEQLIEDAAGLDIIFLDIQMEGLNGIETAERIRKKEIQAVIIFLTALKEYVFWAFDVEAFHYLLKPLKKEKFYEVLEGAVKKAEAQKRLEKARTEGKRIDVKIGAITQKIYTNEIIYAEVYNRKVTLHTLGQSMEFYSRLSELEQELGEDFVRPHRAYLVNMQYISCYHASIITLENGSTVPIAKQKYKDFVQKYLQYIKRTGGNHE